MTTDLTPSMQLLQMMNGYRMMQGLYVAAKLGIADLLRDGPRRSEELAQAVGAHARSLHRLLRALASLDVVTETADGRFALTPCCSSSASSRSTSSQRPRRRTRSSPISTCWC